MKRWAGALILLVTGPCFGDSLSEALASHRFQDAVKLTESLLAAQPRDPRIWTARGMALSNLGQDAESVTSFEHALRLDGRFLPALKGVAQICYRIHDARASKYLDQLISLDPENQVAHSMAGVLAFEAGNYDVAVSHFERGGTETIANEQAYSLLGASFILLHTPAKAIPVFERLLATHPSGRRVRFNLGYAL